MISNIFYYLGWLYLSVSMTIIFKLTLTDWRWWTIIVPTIVLIGIGIGTSNIIKDIKKRK
jgi:hypothetical protein